MTAVAPPPAAVFRDEVANRRYDRLQGDVIVSIPNAWRVVTTAIFAAVTLALIVLATIPYSRSITVAGEIVPSRGLSAIVPPRAGNLKRLMVAIGDHVRRDQVVAVVRIDELMQGGDGTAARTTVEIASQRAQVAAQLSSTASEELAQQRKNLSELAGLDLQIPQLLNQISKQESLIDSAQREVSAAESVAERGFISSRELRARRDTVIFRQQELSRLQLDLIARQSERRQIAASLSVLGAQSKKQRAALSATMAELNERTISTESQSGYALAAPVDGVVSAITARAGQAVDPTRPLLNIIPAASTLQAEVLVPTDRIGFVRTGLDVSLAIEAFPSQRFGTVAGRILSVSGSAARRPDGGDRFFYSAIVEIPQPTVNAFGRVEPLRPGMTLDAHIRSERQSLIAWLFEPLLTAVR